MNGKHSKPKKLIKEIHNWKVSKIGPSQGLNLSDL